MKVKATIDEKPVSIKWSKAKIDVYDPIEKEHLSGSQTIKMSDKISLYTRPRFLAKVALETGYFLFGEAFVENADCGALRKAIFCDDLGTQKLDLRFYDSLHPIEDKDKTDYELINYLIEQMGGSTVILGFAKDRFILSVGILGEYLGMINFSVDIEKFPIKDEYFRLGHVILCRDGQLHRDSFWHTIYQLGKALDLDIDESKIEWM